MSLSAAEQRAATTSNPAKAIFTATQHVRRIAGRSHLKANRIERVDLFMSSLRRELRSATFESTLCRKELWHDAGVLDSAFVQGASYLGGIYNRQDIMRWCQEAEELTRTMSGLAEDIESDLACLGHEVGAIKSIAEKATRIADESTAVLDNIADTVLR